jgi:glycosyltransferase involved in cell wall biosynthesis
MISVCIPTYNGGLYLRDCLASVAGQTFRNYEAIVVDDNSSDDTLKIADEYAQADSRFRVNRNERRLGLVGNWNRCVQLARGSWIKFLFQDDLLLPRCLETMIGEAASKNMLFVGCRREFLFGPGTPSETRQYYAANADEIERFYTPCRTVSAADFAEASLRRFGENFVGEPTATLIHRTLFDQCGMFNENLIMCCDSEYWYRIGSQVGITFIPEALVVFRVHSNSTSSDNFGRRRFRMTFLDPFIVSYEFAFNLRYSALRQIAQARFGANFLARLCRERAQQARRALQEQEYSQTYEAQLRRQEWQDVSMAYPRLSLMAQPPGLWERIWLLARRCRSNAKLRKLLQVFGRSV